MVYMKKEVYPAKVWLTLINQSWNVIQIAKHTVIGTLQLHVNYQVLKNFEVYHLNVEECDTALLCTLPSAKFICSPAEVNTHGKNQSRPYP